MNGYSFQKHLENLQRALIPAETDSGATMRLAEIEKERRERREAERRQKIRVENTAAAEV